MLARSVDYRRSSLWHTFDISTGTKYVIIDSCKLSNTFWLFAIDSTTINKVFWNSNATCVLISVDEISKDVLSSKADSALIKLLVIMRLLIIWFVCKSIIHVIWNKFPPRFNCIATSGAIKFSKSYKLKDEPFFSSLGNYWRLIVVKQLLKAFWNWLENVWNNFYNPVN